MSKEKQQTFSREEVRELLKKQVAKCRDAVGRLPIEADDIQMIKAVAKCKLIKF